MIVNENGWGDKKAPVEQKAPKESPVKKENKNAKQK